MSTPYTLTSGDRRYSGRTNLDAVDARSGAPLVIALHGGTYSSLYFDIPGHSLLDEATGAGVPVIAIDRPNYIDSSPLTPGESIILDNADVLNEAIGTIWAQYSAEHADAPGIVLIAHSIGGAVATAIAAARPSWPLLGLSTSGCFAHIPQESRAAWESLPPIEMIELPTPMKDQVMFGPAGSYDDDMPAASHPSNTLVPKAELLDITGGWIERRAEVCGRVAVPVFHRQAEHDALWITNDDELAEFRAGFTSAPSVDIEIEPGTGHCIDFHAAGAQFQRAELAFALAVAADAAAQAA